MYADIFVTEESEKRLYFALCIVFHVHNSQCHQHRQCQLHNMMTPSVTPWIMRSQAASVVWSASSDSIQVQVTTKCFSFCFDIIQKLFFFFWKELESGSENDDDDHDYHEMPPPPPSPPLSISRIYSWPNKHPIVLLDATPSPSSIITMHYNPQYCPIYKFLQASKPAMTHLMDPVINFGCIKFLQAISSWSSEKITYFLNQLPPGCDGGKIMEMEKFILQHHFKDYFV